MRYRALAYRLPSREISNDEVLRRIREDSGPYLSAAELDRVSRLLRFAFRSLGTRVRYGRLDGEKPWALCVEAGRDALRRADMDPQQIDLLVYVGVGRGFIEPATANVFQDLLGLSNATCFDVMDACASWVRAVDIARSFLAAGTYRNVMILNAEFNGNFESYALRSVDEFDYRFPAFTIGEAATATILSDSDADDDYATRFRSFGDQRDRCIIPLSNWADYLAADGDELEPHRFVSHGRDIMEFGLEKLVEQYRKEPDFHRWEPGIVFFHAASDGMAREGMRRCGLDESLGYYSHGRFANTVSATIPLAMAAAEQQGRLREGMPVLLAIASAGISTALSRFTYLR